MIGSRLSNKYLYRFLLWILLIAGIILLIRLAPILSKPEYIPVDDFFHLWAGGNQNLQGKNPFDPQIIEQLRNLEGGNPTQAKISITLNPPWVISIFMPFGLLKYSISRIIWLILSIALILLSTQLLWQIYAGKPKQRWIGILIVFIFSSTISVLEKGQVTGFVLLGLTGFLYFEVVDRKDWLAGACLSFATFKPQVVLLFWLVLLFWVIQQRRWVILISMAGTIFLLTLITFVFNPHVLTQYLSMLQSYGLSDWANPTIGAYLRFFWFGLDKFWLQYLPSLIAGVWAAYYWFRHNKPWDWVKELPVILLISIITSPYAWTYDQVILIPVIIQSASWVISDWKRLSTLIATIFYLALNLLNLLLHRKLDDFWFIWSAPALLIFYLLIRWRYTVSHGKIRQSPQVTG